MVQTIPTTRPIRILTGIGLVLLTALAGCAADGKPATPTSVPPTTFAAASTSTVSAAPTTQPPVVGTEASETDVVSTVPVVATVSFPTADGTVTVATLRNEATPALPVGAHPFLVDYQGHNVHGIDIPGPGTPIVLLHGFPDNLHLYDELFPLLAGQRRVIAFDFIGWGESDKPLPGEFEYSMSANEGQIGAVLDQLDTGAVELVVHDASGISGIDFALSRPQMVAKLVMLNTFYGLSPTQSPPDAINIYAAAGLQEVEAAINVDPAALEGLYRYQINLFLDGNPNASTIVDRLWSQFPEALPAFTALNDVLFSEVRDHTIGFGRLGDLSMPVALVFGAKDANLTEAVGEDLASRIPGARLTVVGSAGHFVQIDAPEAVAFELLS
jgi:haloalkane dehalogenase